MDNTSYFLAEMTYLANFLYRTYGYKLKDGTYVAFNKFEVHKDCPLDVDTSMLLDLMVAFGLLEEFYDPATQGQAFRYRD
jgi:hypothetical protein